MTQTKSQGIGLIGCGAFGEFCLDAFRKLDSAHVAAVADTIPDAARRLGERFDVPAFDNAEALIARDDVDLVHVATPPSSHHTLVLEALKAGKNVLCEKPLAMTVAEADEMLSAAEKSGCICPVNFVLRYNEVTEAVKTVLASGLLGEPLAGRLTNCAADSRLGDDHWFWDKSVSGGIFIEHGVHFFDLYRYWLGDGQAVSAHLETQQSNGRESRVTCLVRHDGGALVSHHHGFDQVAMMDRTDHRIVCELGDIMVEGWIPLTMRLLAAVDDEGVEKLRGLLGHAEIEVVQRFEGDQSRTSGRGKQRRVTQVVRVSYTPNPDKQGVYASSVTELLADQLAYLADRKRPRRVGEQNGRAAVALAEEANNRATTGEA